MILLIILKRKCVREKQNRYKIYVKEQKLNKLTELVLNLSWKTHTTEGLNQTYQVLKTVDILRKVSRSEEK